MRYPTDIILVTWHRQELTEMVIKAIHANTDRDHFRLIVIDNGSPQEMANRLMDLYQDGLIDHLELNSYNMGLEPARNKGLELVESDRFVCADNDCLPQKRVDGKDWLEKLHELMDFYPEYAAIACRTQVMIGTGNLFEGKEDSDVIDFAHPGGSLRIMDTESVKGVGGWRSDSTGRGAEERYICGLLREYGFKTGFAVKIKTLHLFGDRAQKTDRWGYPENWQPEDTGHSDIWHPSLAQGDDPEEIAEYLSA